MQSCNFSFDHENSARMNLTSALYIGTLIDRLKRAISCRNYRSLSTRQYIPSDSHTRDKPTAQNIRRASIICGGGCLYYHSNAEYADIQKDRILARDSFAEDTGIQSTEPRTEFKNSCFKALVACTRKMLSNLYLSAILSWSHL